ncbi:MAG: hypothetical protein KYX68_06975 [Flavobacterium sp.]|nr:hypothetical protein [Flavobacterium sp.]
MKTRAISLLLFIVLLLPAVVTFSWLQHRKYVVKKEVKQTIIAGIDKKELQILKFHHQEVNQKVEWEHSKEFEFNGKMYDIVKKEIVNDSVQFFCWLDEEETELNRRLKTLLINVYHNDVPLKLKNDLVLDFYKSLFFHQTDLVVFYLRFKSTRIKSYYTNNYFFQYQNTEIHPPIFV